MTGLVESGVILHGFCLGFFGRDSHECKYVEASGPDWIVARGDKSSEPLFAYFGKDWIDKAPSLIADWQTPMAFTAYDATIEYRCCDA